MSDKKLQKDNLCLFVCAVNKDILSSLWDYCDTVKKWVQYMYPTVMVLILKDLCPTIQCSPIKQITTREEMVDVKLQEESHSVQK